MLDLAEPIQSVKKSYSYPPPHIFKKLFSDSLANGLVIWITSTQALQDDTMLQAHAMAKLCPI